MKLLKLILIVAAMIAIFGCARNDLAVSNELHEAFLQLISIEDINNSMQVTVVESEVTQPTFGSEVEIFIQNVSTEKEIYFSPEESLALRIFVNSNNRWIEIQNADRYTGEGGVLDTKGQITSDWITGVRPVLELNLLKEIDNPVIVRILVTGELIVGNEKTGTPVATFIDLIMKP
jgi:hypothetical protein